MRSTVLACRLAVYLCLVLSLAGCARSRLATPQPALRPGELPQPRMSLLLDYLLGRGVTSASDAPVFMLSHWLMYNGPMDDNDPIRPRFEGSPLTYEGSKVFLAIGPVYKGLKKAPPPEKDVVMPYRPSEDEQEDVEVRGTTFMLAGQQWSLGFSMKHGNEQLKNRMTALLWEFLEAYRREHGAGQGAGT